MDLNSNRKRLGLGLGNLKNSFPPRNPEIETKFREINKKNGILEINGTSYKTTINDLEDLGELGNGTSGHVVKMKHQPSNAIIAVKVIYQSISFLCEFSQSNFYFSFPANASNWQR